MPSPAWQALAFDFAKSSRTAGLRQPVFKSLVTRLNRRIGLAHHHLHVVERKSGTQHQQVIFFERAQGLADAHMQGGVEA